MKTFVVVLAAAVLLGIGAMVYAHDPGAGWGGGHMMGGYGGHMMGYGYGGPMMGQGYGGRMMDWRGPASGDDAKFLDETANLRKELHEKRFDYFEASRNPETDPATLSKLEKEIYEIQSKIGEKAPRRTYGGYGGGYGRCW